MAHSMNRFLGITLSGLIFLGGCAAYDAAKRGEAAMAGGQYDDAVQAYSEAVTLSPDSTKYRRLLLGAKRERANQRLAAAAASHSRGLLIEARALCQAVLADFADDQRAIQLRDQLTAQYDAAAAEVAKAEAELGARREPVQVAQRLTQMAWLTPTFAQIPKLIQIAQDMDASNQKTSQGAALLAQRDYEPALIVLAEAQRLDASNTAATELWQKTQEQLAAVLSRQAAVDEAALRHSVAVAQYERASTLLGHRPPAEAQAQWRHAQDIRDGLARRAIAAGEHSSGAALQGAQWVHYQAAALLAPQSRTPPLPELEPQVHYRIEPSVLAAPELTLRLYPAIEKALAPYKTSRVDLLPPGDGHAQVLLRVEIPQSNLATTRGRTETRSTRYVQRIDVVSNPKYENLREQEAQLGQQLAQVDRDYGPARSENRRLQEGQDQVNAAVEAFNERSADVNSRVEEVNRIQSNLNTASPEQRRGWREDLRRAEAALERARHGRARARERLEQMRINNPEATANRAHREERRLAEEHDQLASSLQSVQNRLGNTSSTKEVKVWADYSYAESYQTRAATAAGGHAELWDVQTQQSLANTKLSGSVAMEDYVRSEHRRPGAPDLYIAPHTPQWISDDMFYDRLTHILTTGTFRKFDAALRHHCDRFVQQARGGQGAARLHAWALAYYCREQVSDAAALRDAVKELRDASGLLVDKNQVDLTYFDGQPLFAAGASAKAQTAAPPARPTPARPK